MLLDEMAVLIAQITTFCCGSHFPGMAPDVAARCGKKRHGANDTTIAPQCGPTRASSWIWGASSIQVYYIYNYDTYIYMIYIYDILIILVDYNRL